MRDRISWSPSELLAENFGQLRFYLEPISAPGSTLVLFGPREAGKTQLLFTMIRAMHEERLLLGRFPAKKAKVALVEVDMTVVTTQERLKAAAQEYTFSDSLFRIATPTSLDLLHIPASTAWIRDLQEFAPDIVAFDSLRKVHKEDENNPAVPSQLYGRCKELFPKSAFWFAHHVKKPPATWLADKHSYKQQEDLNAFRGTSAWLDDADAAIYLYKDANTEKRSFQLVRARYAEDAIKHEVIGVKLKPSSMFLEPDQLSERQWALHWHLQNPKAEVGELVDALKAAFPNHNRTSYYKWAQNAMKQVTP